MIAAESGHADGFPTREHDHAICIEEALAAADRLCRSRGVRLTRLRRRVLEIVWSSHRPTGAYEILQRLALEDGRKAAPPTVYRALEFLLQQGLVHRIESRNAFIGCIRPESRHAVGILLCRACGRAAEVTDQRIVRAVQSAAAAHDFESEAQTVEVIGRCGDCREQASHA